MAKTTTIPIETLRQLLDYNPDTGELVWKPRPIENWQDLAKGRTWNTRYSGKPALNAPLQGRYFHGRIFDTGYRAHRVCWALHYGEWPNDIDHIDHNGFNNRITNLRSVTTAENLQNQSMQKRNTSGCCGVHWATRDKRWIAAIKANGVEIKLGNFLSKWDAIAARKAAEIKYGFHPNHGS